MKSTVDSANRYGNLTKSLRCIVLTSFLMTGACGAQEAAEVDDSDDTVQTEQEVAGAEQPGDLNPVEAQTFVDDVMIGKSIEPDGAITAEEQGDDFAAGETVYVSLNVSDAPAGSAVKLFWYGPGEMNLKEEEKQVEAGGKYLSFDVGTASWQKGDYRAEVWIGDEKVNTQQFQIVDPGEMPPEDGPDGP